MSKSAKKVLGRGLGALIPQKDSQPIGHSGSALELPVEAITPNPYQPRKTFDDAAIRELSESVRSHGIVQPLLVTRNGEKYQLIAGERRFRAAKLAGLTTVPAIVKDPIVGLGALEIALIENIQREDLNPIEEALAYQQLHDEFGLTQDEVAKRVGKERSTVANHLRLLKLPDKVKTLVAATQLTMGHARALLALQTAKQQEELAERAVRDDLSVRQVEAIVSPPPPKPKKQQEQKDVFTRDAEERLQKSLRTKVEIRRKRRGGTIQVAFANEDELIRLFESLTGGRRA
ncbi:MAG: ParB/RepB/Spo0J family partition protein [Acidobacteria bacterium]|nr:ParB/RepB/Spo0J family partition protein [Acidobacteriota bacterium]